MRKSTNKTLTLSAGCIAVALCAGATASAHRLAADEYQGNLLFNPSARQLQREAEGKVYIYDGLTDVTVERALDQHTDRMQNMMFVRTIKTDGRGRPLRDEETGNYVTENDGCD